MTFTTAEIRKDYLEKTIRVGGSPVTREMCRVAAEKNSIKANPVASMQRRIEKIYTDPSGKEKPMVILNRPRVIGTFKTKEKEV